MNRRKQNEKKINKGSGNVFAPLESPHTNRESPKKKNDLQKCSNSHKNEE
jgi:hypothetical protein